ncbi:MAG TPA: methylamine utilization protein MauJ [Paracoccus sp. (in: a-proteobacteria)]|nr:methylamine utilization protein MauJ [Paracoccus sp. (in: a-proteobacteria)]
MWIPYDIRGTLTPASRPDSIRLSIADAAPREFLIGFLLRNPVTQQWELDVIADPAGHELSGAGEDANLRIGFYGNEAGKLTEIILRLTSTSAQAALQRAHGALQPRLLRYVIETGRGMAVAGWRIADTTHDARWRCTPFRPSALILDHDTLDPLAPDLAPVAELFQRARNAPDAAGRMLAAFAVLRAAQTGHPALARAGTEEFRVTSEMLVHAGAMDSAAVLVGCDLDGLIAALRLQHDRLIGPDGVLAPLADDLPAQQALARLANLADLVAHRLLTAEIRARRGAGGHAPAGIRGKVAAC